MVTEYWLPVMHLVVYDEAHLLEGELLGLLLAEEVELHVWLEGASAQLEEAHHRQELELGHTGSEHKNWQKEEEQ